MHFVHWRRGVCILQMVMALGWALEAPSASACSPPPPYMPQWFSTLEASVPADGATDVLPEGLIRVARRSWPVPGTPGPDSARFSHDVTVIDLETGTEVKGSLRDTEWGYSEVQYWKPDSRLLPNRRYALVQSLTQSVSQPDNVQGPTQTRSSFTTGNRQLSALSVSGQLEARMDSYETTLCEGGAPVRPCEVCRSTRPESRHGIRIRVPAIQGGFTFEAYRIEVVATRDTPHDFSQPDGNNVRSLLVREILSSSGKPVDGILELPLTVNIAARPCVAWRVVDSLGNVHEGAPVCLDAPARSPGPTLSDVPGYLGLGCSLGGAHTAPAALGLLVLLARVRRRTARAS